MAVIKIDDELHREIIKLIKGKRRFEYPNIKSFIDKTIYEKLKELEKLN